MCAGHGLGDRRERAPGDDEMRSFPPPPPFLDERYCPTVDLDYTHTLSFIHTTGFRTDFHDVDTHTYTPSKSVYGRYVKKKT